MSEINLRSLKQEDLTSFKDAISTTVDKKDTKEEEKLTPRELSIYIEYDTPEGEKIKDNLISRIADADTRMSMTRIVSKLSAGMIFDDLPYLDRVRILALARCVTQIKDIPEWLNSWLATDDDLLFLLNQKLVEHETKFFRRDNSQSENGKTEARIRFAPSVLTVSSALDKSKKSTTGKS